MKNNSIELLPSLKPLSRDHGIVLVCAQYGRKAMRASTMERLKIAEQMRSICKLEIAPNLEDEQWILSPIIGDVGLRTEFHQRHRNIKQLIEQLFEVELFDDPGLGLISRIANALDDYVRWEENTLFPRIVEGMNKFDSLQLSKVTSKLEEGRNRPTQQLHSSVTLQQPSGLQCYSMQLRKPA